MSSRLNVWVVPRSDSGPREAATLSNTTCLDRDCLLMPAAFKGDSGRDHKVARTLTCQNVFLCC